MRQYSMSVATINAPEFINLQPSDISPLMSSCEIKVLYIGENHNRTMISKEVALDMAKTLRGCPIVGYYKDDKEDFRDHGEFITIDADGIKFQRETKPYGFVSPDAKVWFQEFEDTNAQGKTITREYLMTTGYLWTEQYEECKLAIEEGRPQSMEIDEASVQGQWTKNNNSNLEFFIINDATFSKLCILGEDIEPCFEGAEVAAPKVSTQFTKDENVFKRTLYSMMQELQTALEGGQQMENQNPTVQETSEVTPVTEYAETQVQDSNTDVPATDFAKNEEPEKKDAEKEKSDSNSSDSEKADDKETDNSEKKDDEEDKKKKNNEYALLQSQYTELQGKFATLEAQYAELVSYKQKQEDAEKDELIGKFYMLSDEDKKDVIENKTKYSLSEIESKLSVICFHKKVNFNLEDNTKNNEIVDKGIITYQMAPETETSSLPDWVKAVREVEKNNNN